MINTIPKPVFILVSLLLCLVLYWPSMNGQPVWDDLSYWFNYDVITKDFSYLTIWGNFGWPLSVSIQKLLFGWWNHQYLNYHLLNFLLHGLNAFFLMKVAERLKLPYARILFLLFLLHPANVISVSWMIQLKTLLCFLFALVSFYFLIKAEEQKKWFLLSWIFFFLSLTSKSASIPLSIFFLLYSFKKMKRIELLWLLPFFILSFGATGRMLASPVTSSAMAMVENQEPAPINAETASQFPKKSESSAPVETKVVPAIPTTNKKVTSRFVTFISTTHYYFWQTLLPMENQPVKGLKYSGPGALEALHFIFLILVVIINWGKATSIFLGCGYLMLLPFLGIIPAPYMNLAWVSDQHLYLAMPFFICFWLSLAQKVKLKYASFIPLIFLPIYCYKVAIATPLYKNEVTFYKASLQADPLNVPIAYNLAFTYVKKGQITQALEVTNHIIQLTEVAPEIYYNKYFPAFFMLHLKLQNHSIKKIK